MTVLYIPMLSYGNDFRSAVESSSTGAVISDDGFGFVTLPSGHVKVHHIGTVVIEDDVEVAPIQLWKEVPAGQRLSVGVLRSAILSRWDIM